MVGHFGDDLWRLHDIRYADAIRTAAPASRFIGGSKDDNHYTWLVVDRPQVFAFYTAAEMALQAQSSRDFKHQQAREALVERVTKWRTLLVPHTRTLAEVAALELHPILSMLIGYDRNGSVMRGFDALGRRYYSMSTTDLVVARRHVPAGAGAIPEVSDASRQLLVWVDLDWERKQLLLVEATRASDAPIVGSSLDYRQWNGLVCDAELPTTTTTTTTTSSGSSDEKMNVMRVLATGKFDGIPVAWALVDAPSWRMYWHDKRSVAEMARDDVDVVEE